MPLVRCQVRNEYGLGAPELYKTVNKDDPKSILDGVAVAGLVGILRQLGDLAEFAAEVFHGVQEQVIATATRTKRMVVHLQYLEAALPPLEKIVLAQTSHIHLAYTAGSDWHANIKIEKNHFIYSDLPRFIMDSYEECRDPPRLHLLDKFDTGGPGACLKKYSDPTFFKKVFASSESVNTENVQRERKARKSKKRGSRHRNEVLRAMQTSNNSGRMQFASPNISERNSASDTLSTFDQRSKSVFVDHRTSSDYIECVFDVSSSMRPDEPEEIELYTARPTIQNSDTISLVQPDEQNALVVDDLSQVPFHEQSVLNTSSVTWDEKTEIVKPPGQHYDITDDQGETSKLLPESIDQSELERETSILRSVDAKDILFDDENTLASFSGANQFEEIGSEVDNYMDAPNTIESEIETDSECQTKREVEFPSSNFRSKEIELETGMMHDIAPRRSDSSDVESRTVSYGSSNNERTIQFSESVSSEDFTVLQPSQITGTSIGDGSVDTDLCNFTNVLDDSRMHFIGTSSNEDVSMDTGLYESTNACDDSRMPYSQALSCKSQEVPTEISGVSSIKFWTNGGLLGLEPSKPPDFSVSNALSKNSTPGTEEETSDPSGHSVEPAAHTDELVTKVDTFVKTTPECITKKADSVGGRYKSPNFIKPTSLPPDQKNYLEYPSSGSQPKLFNSTDTHQNSSFSHAHEYSLKETVSMPTKVEFLVGPEIKALSSESGEEKIESSNISSISHRLFVNGFQRKASNVNDDTSEPAAFTKNGAMKSQELLCVDQKKRQNGVVHQTSRQPILKEHHENESPTSSLSSSPPLEHMKISFHPKKEFEIPKLRLKFSEEHHFQESISDGVFPSFQLLPEPGIHLRSTDSESDDDTFCRSSLYMSDDLLSHHSESSSEQWESEETSGSKNNEISDSLHRVFSFDSIFNSSEVEGISHGGFYPDSGFESPNAKTGVEVILINVEETRSDSDLVSEYQHSTETVPPPPPLPPVERQTTEPHFFVIEEGQGTISVAADQPKDLQITSEKSKPAPRELPHIEESNAYPSKNKEFRQDTQKSNGQKESNQAVNGNEMDEKEDFLHQIRTKSFNLKRAAPAGPTLSPAPTTNVKVAAILEKANAIRQACAGSDDGGEEDGNWSDS